MTEPAVRTTTLPQKDPPSPADTPRLPRRVRRGGEVTPSVEPATANTAPPATATPEVAAALEATDEALACIGRAALEASARGQLLEDYVEELRVVVEAYDAFQAKGST
jgi:hypothetical protein